MQTDCPIGGERAPARNGPTDSSSSRQPGATPQHLHQNCDCHHDEKGEADQEQHKRDTRYDVAKSMLMARAVRESGHHSQHYVDDGEDDQVSTSHHHFVVCGIAAALVKWAPMLVQARRRRCLRATTSWQHFPVTRPGVLPLAWVWCWYQPFEEGGRRGRSRAGDCQSGGPPERGTG
jgi:hypothetical protein